MWTFLRQVLSGNLVLNGTRLGRHCYTLVIEYLQVLLWDNFEVHRLRVEIEPQDYIVENHTETFSMVWKENIYSR